MRHFIIASHGTLSEGFYKSSKIIIGVKPNVHIITAYVNDSDIEKLVREKVTSINENDEIIVLTDLYGGSVNNECMKYICKKNFHLVAGINLPLLIQLLISEEIDTKKMIREAVKESSKAIIYCNDLNTKKDDEDF